MLCKAAWNCWLYILQSQLPVNFTIRMRGHHWLKFCQETKMALILNVYRPKRCLCLLVSLLSFFSTTKVHDTSPITTLQCIYCGGNEQNTADDKDRKWKCKAPFNMDKILYSIIIRGYCEDLQVHKSMYTVC